MQTNQTLAGDVTAMYQQACRPFVSLAAAQAELMGRMMNAQMQLWQAAQSAALAATVAGWKTDADGDERSEMAPSLAIAMRDMQDCGEAVLRAQIDALEAVRRSA